MFPINYVPTQREALEHTAIGLMVRSMRAHHRIMDKRIDSLGVHQSQHRMLMMLSRMGRTASQKDIAQAQDVSPACVARALKALSAAGLVEKAEGSDGRCREISLSPAGHALVDASMNTFRQTDAEMFAGIPDEDVSRLIEILEKIHQNLSGMEKPDAPERSDRP